MQVPVRHHRLHMNWKKLERGCRNRNRDPYRCYSLRLVITLITLCLFALIPTDSNNSPAMASAFASKAACSAIPRVGLGTMMITEEQMPQAIASAIALGYRRIDCAPVYFNEEKVGDALQTVLSDSPVSRQDLFVVSKLASPFHKKEHVELALKKTLADLRVDYLDLFLIHWPVAFHPVLPIPMDVRGWPTEDIDDSGDGAKIDPSVSVHETWMAMEELVEKGLVKSIGVSNFPVSLLHELMTRAKIPPAVNQVEAHPYLQQTRLLNYCKARGVHFQAYSPLGTPGYKEDDEPVILEDPVLQSMAKKHNVSVAEICLAWAIQRGTSVVAKSASSQHQSQNMKVVKNPTAEGEGAHELAIILSEEDMKEIAKLERGFRYFRPEDWWPEFAVAVFD